ncbi:MAG: beta-lactamase family protein, partial [Alphaproteobacteria bacterium]|nr:beta-lactamase family protein [Alphaproteobacteria bacterium]
MLRFSQTVLPVCPVEGETRHWPIEERLAHYTCPGVSLCVIENGDIVDAAGFGVVTPGGAAVQADTMFAGASISKPVTAVLALQLVESGVLSLDAPVNAYLRSWKLPENDFTREEPVTLRHLLSHRAGTTVHGFGAFPRGQQAPSLLDMLTGAPPSPTPAVEVDKRPGQSVRYSGGGTQIVQLLLEEATGLAFADLAARQVFEPLKMQRTTFRQPLPAECEPYAAPGHHGDGSVVDGRFTFTPQLAAGGIYTTGPDYARFMIECRNAWLGKDNCLIGQPLAREMMTRQGGGQFGL